MKFENGYTALRLKAEKPAAVSYLHPGQLSVSADPLRMMTILGSCVAVCIWDSLLKVGGMVHYLLPNWDPNCGAKSPRYGDVGIAALLDEMEALNSSTSRMHARVFGGGCVLQAFRNRGGVHLGDKNAECARNVLAQRRIPIIESDTLGDLTRKIFFDTATGVAVVSHVGGSNEL